MENSNDQRLSFSFPGETTIVDVISEILLNNSVIETPEQRFEKERQNKPSFSIIIRDAARGLADKKISENDLIFSLQTQLGVDKNVAAKIISEIKQKIIPFAKKIKLLQITEPPVDTPQKTDVFTKIKNPIGVEEILGKTDQTPNTTDKEPLTKIERAKAKLKKEGLETKEKPIVKKSTEPDTYREPIA